MPPTLARRTRESPHRRGRSRSGRGKCRACTASSRSRPTPASWEPSGRGLPLRQSRREATPLYLETPSAPPGPRGATHRSRDKLRSREGHAAQPNVQSRCGRFELGHATPRRDSVHRGRSAGSVLELGEAPLPAFGASARGAGGRTRRRDELSGTSRSGRRGAGESYRHGQAPLPRLGLAPSRTPTPSRHSPATFQPQPAPAPTRPCLFAGQPATPAAQTPRKKRDRRTRLRGCLPSDRWGPLVFGRGLSRC
jgi:hypothetical protein